MSEPGASTTGAGQQEEAGDNWPAEAADTVVRLVDSVKSKTTGPAITIARAVVYGLLAAVMGIAALVLLAIIAVRVLDAYLPEAWFGESHTWAAHLVVGAVFFVLGLFAFHQARRRPAEDSG